MLGIRKTRVVINGRRFKLRKLTRTEALRISARVDREREVLRGFPLPDPDTPEARERMRAALIWMRDVLCDDLLQLTAKDRAWLHFQAVDPVMLTEAYKVGINYLARSV